MKNLKLKTSLLIAVFAISQFVANAQPGILEVVLKSTSTNIKETITIGNQIGDISAISILNSKNQIVYQAKHSIGQSTKVFCELPKGVYRITTANVNGRNKQITYQINIE